MAFPWQWTKLLAPARARFLTRSTRRSPRRRIPLAIEELEPRNLLSGFAVNLTGVPAHSTSPEGTAITLGSSLTNTTPGDTFTYAWNVNLKNASYASGTGSSLTFTPDDNGSYSVSLTVTDKAGLTAKATQALSIYDVAPTVTVPDSFAGLALSPLTFTGVSVTDPSSVDTAAGFRFAWYFGDGGSGSGSSPTHTFAKPGTHTVRVTAFDKDGLAGTATTTVTIVGPALTTTLTAPKTVTAGTTDAAVTFSTVTGGTGGYTYSFDFGNTGSFEITGSGSPTATIPESYVDAGPATLTILGRVTDSAGHYRDFTTHVKITDVAPTPSIVLPAPLVAKTALTFSDPATDPSSADTAAGFKYSWKFGDGTAAATGESVTHTYAKNGTYTVTVTVTDKHGKSSTMKETITVGNPYAVFSGPASVTEGTSNAQVTFTKPAGTGYTYSYDFGDTGTFQITASTSPSAVIPESYLDTAGTLLVHGRVTDSTGKSTDYTTAIQITAVAPTPRITPPNVIDSGVAASFTASATSPSTAETNAGFTYQWNFGDGTTPVSGANPTHTFATPGTYTVTLTAIDAENVTGSTTVSVAVTGPSATFTGPATVSEGTTTAQVAFTNPAGGSGGYTYSYDFGNTGTFEITNSSSATAVIPESYVDAAGTVVVHGRVTDSTGVSIDYTTSITVKNVPPSPSITAPASTDVGIAAAFQASATDPSTADTSAGFTYSWNFGDKTTPVTGADPSHVFTAPGTYTVTLTATDKNGGVGTATVQYTVLSAPSATFSGPSSVSAGTTNAQVTFTKPTGGSGGYTYSYDFGDTGTFEITGSTSATATIPESYVDATGTLVVRARITDSLGDSSTYTTSITINDVAPAPSITLPASVTAGTAATYDASATNPSGADTKAGFTYTWNFGDGSKSVTGASPSHTYATAGSYTVTLTATDQHGKSGATTATVTAATTALTATFTGPSSISAGSTNAQVSFTNPTGGSGGYTYSYDFGNAGTFEISGSATATATIPESYTDAPGTLVVHGRITDTSGGYTDYTTTITINDVAPTPTIAPPSIIDAGTAATFQASATDPSTADTNAGFTYTWNFGDGTAPVSSASVSHTYASAGEYTVTLTATDSHGLTSTTTISVVVGQVITEGHPGFSTTGSWTWDPTWGVDLYAAAGTGSSVATWQAAVAPGTYQIWATWVGDGPRADNAPYTILDGGSPQGVVTVNQRSWPLGIQDAGVTWQSLGVFSIQSGQLVVQLSNNADSYVIAEGIRFQLDNGAPITPALSITGLPSSGQVPVETAVNLGCKVIAPGANGNLQYAWTVTKNGQDFATGNTASFSFTPDDNVTYQISLTVTTAAGVSATASGSITATPVAPTVSLAKSFSGKEDWEVDFSANGSDVSPEDAASLRYVWNFGDGTTGTGADPTHVYTQSGTYNTTVTVTDKNGLTATASATASIANLGPAPSYIVTPYLNIPDFGYDPTIYSVTSGNWSDPATWNLDRVPAVSDIVDIDAGTTVTYDVDDTTDAAPLNTVEVENGGVLIFSTTQNTQMYVVNLLVLQGGELDIGTQANPVPTNITATVVWVNQLLNTALDPEQYGNGLIVLGTFNTYGAAKVPYVTLAQNASAGDTVLYLASPATGWRVGDSLQLPDTRELDSNDEGSNYTPEWETAKIQSISSNGEIVTLTAPLQFSHLGGYNAAGNLEYLPQVVDMTRNVTIHSQSATGTRGYALFTDRANVNVNYTAFTGMGRTTNADFNNAGPPLFDNTTFDANGNVIHVGTNEENRDAITFLDLIGPTSPQADGYQFTFNGNVVTCPLTPMPFLWGIRLANSSYGLIEENDVVNWAGAGVVGDYTSMDNNFTGNFVMRINGSGGRGSGDMGFGGDGFWFGNPYNSVDDNIVTDLNPYGPYGYAYEFYVEGDPEGLIGYKTVPAYQGADPTQPGQSKSVDVNQLPILSFDGDEAYGVVSIGLSYWQTDYDPVNAPQPVANGGDIDNFVCWNLFYTGIYGYSSNNITINSFVCLGSASVVQAGFVTWGMQFQDYFTGNVTINQADIEDQGIGILDPDNTGGTVTIENSYLADATDIEVAGLWSVSYGVPPRDTVINNVQFTGIAPGHSYTAIWMDWYNASQIASGVILGQMDQVFVYNYDGVTGDSFQVFYTQQAANFVIPQGVDGANGTLLPLSGPPVAGLTNAQSWAQYNVAIAGAVAPADATTVSNIDGLVAPIPS